LTIHTLVSNIQLLPIGIVINMLDIGSSFYTQQLNASDHYDKIIKWFKLRGNQYIGYITKLQFEDYITIRNKDGEWITFKVQQNRTHDFRDNEMVTVQFPNDFEIVNLSPTNFNDGKFIVNNFKKRRYVK
jgi:hypothetical protein